MLCGTSVVFTTILIASCLCIDKRCSFINHGKISKTNASDSSRGCPEHEVCRKTFNISYIDVPPYSSGQLFEWIVKGCCGSSCTKFNMINYYRNISEVNLSETPSADFILPFLGKSSDVSLYGNHFIPFTDVPCAYYITPKHEPPIRKMLKNCLGLYKLIVFSLLAAILSGFIIWSLETAFRARNSESPSFFQGVFDGFYWSFTTVTGGDGSEIIQTLPTKVYTVIWILVGVLMFSVINSVFTVELMTALQTESGHSDSMTGDKVGVLKYRDYDASLVTREGGSIVVSNGCDFEEDLLVLMRMLRGREIDGMLLDKYTKKYVEGYLRWKKTSFVPHANGKHDISDADPVEDINYFLGSTDSTLISYRGEKLSYGVVVKKTVDYLFLKDAVKDNRLSLEAAVESEMNKDFTKKREDMVVASLHHLPINYIGVAVGFIFVLGLTFEVRKYCKERKKSDCCASV